MRRTRGLRSGERVTSTRGTAGGLRSAEPSPGGAGRVWALNAALAGAAYAVVAAVMPLPAIGGSHSVPWWAFAIAFFLSEMFVIRLDLRSNAHTFSLGDIPMVLGCFFVSPVHLVSARVLGGGLALAVSRRQPPLKLVFNVCQFALSTSVAVVVFRAVLGGADPVGPRVWTGAFASTLAMDLVAAALISAAVSLREGRVEVGSLSEVFGLGALMTITNTGLGLMAVALLSWDLWAAWLLVLVGIVLFLSYRGYASVRQRHESLRLLYESTRMAHSPESDSLVSTVLSHAAAMFSAETAELVLFGPPEDRAAATRTVLTADGTAAVESVRVDLTDPIWALPIGQGRALLAARPVKDEALRRHLSARGVRDAMVAVLRGERDVVGAMLVGNRGSDADTFDQGDLRLFETLANHVSVALDNAQLIGRLRRQAEENRYMALHDPLTDLPNRALFRMRVKQAIAEAERNEDAVAAMIIDLDRFKEVNDTLGHHTGDEVLREAGSRLRRSLGDGGMVARLGGDEFAVLLPHLRGAADAQAVADRLLAALERPFLVEDLSLDVGASIGISMFPDHGPDADALIQRADVAMYLAKEEHAGCAVYDPARDRYTPERLQLVGDLRQAIEAGALTVYYQPKADLRSGAVVGVEALVRWEHPRRGMLFPDEFVPLAEHTGLIRPMTFGVLNEALRQCRRWARAGVDLRVAVNVSARSLLDVSLPNAIGDLLATWGVPASSLELEITESSIMADPSRSVAILNRLSAMGVGLSIDDFGTGYSSLSHLKKLPVHEIKIDRSFVMQMMEDQDDAAIVRSTIDLCRNIGFRVVAEGVESPDVMAVLARLGCDLVQGYHLSPPMAADEVVAWLRRYDARMQTSGGDRETAASGGTVTRLAARRARSLV